MVFITDHGYHLSHSVVDTFYTSISTGVIDTCCESSLYTADAKQAQNGVHYRTGGWVGIPIEE